MPDNLEVMIKMLARVNRKGSQRVGLDIVGERLQLMVYVLDLLRKIENVMTQVTDREASFLVEFIKPVTEEQ